MVEDAGVSDPVPRLPRGTERNGSARMLDLDAPARYSLVSRDPNRRGIHTCFLWDGDERHLLPPAQELRSASLSDVKRERPAGNQAALSGWSRPLTWGGPVGGVRGGYDFPPMAHQADRTHTQGGMVTGAHFPGPSGELAVDVALGKIDSVDLFTWGNTFAGPAGQSAVE